jgi:hypothetical protein
MLGRLLQLSERELLDPRPALRLGVRCFRLLRGLMEFKGVPFLPFLDEFGWMFSASKTSVGVPMDPLRLLCTLIAESFVEEPFSFGVLCALCIPKRFGVILEVGVPLGFVGVNPLPPRRLIGVASASKVPICSSASEDMKEAINSTALRLLHAQSCF